MHHLFGAKVSLIIKLLEEMKWLSFSRRSRFVKAIRLVEDSIFETQQGWVQGYKGQWLVEIGEKLRANYDHEAFIRIYRPARRKGDGE